MVLSQCYMFITSFVSTPRLKVVVLVTVPMWDRNYNNTHCSNLPLVLTSILGSTYNMDEAPPHEVTHSTLFLRHCIFDTSPEGF
jgi:hypothetical protein